MNKQPVYNTLIVNRICNTHRIPKPIGSKINEYLEFLECKYINGDKIQKNDLLLHKSNSTLKTSFPSTHDQLLDLADRLNINLVFESGLKGFITLFQHKYIVTITSTFNISPFCTLLRKLIESPYLQSTLVLTFLNNMIINEQKHIDIDIELLIGSIGTIKAYLWLKENYNYKHFNLNPNTSFYDFYLLESIFNTGTLDDLLFFDSSIKEIPPHFAHKILISFTYYHKWLVNKWNDIKRVPMIIWLLKKFYTQVTTKEFIDTLHHIFDCFDILRHIPTSCFQENVIITFFMELKEHFHFIIEQPVILNLIAMKRTPFFIRFWWFKNYQIPLPDPFNEIQDNNLSYAYCYFEYYCTDEQLQMNYSNQYRSKITKEMLFYALSSAHVTMKELDWFLNFFQLQSFLSNIDALEAIATTNYVAARDYINDIFRERYRWLIRNGAYKSDNLLITFSTHHFHPNNFPKYDIFAKMLRFVGFTINQELINYVATPSDMDNNKVNYQLLFLILDICFNENIKVRFPDTFCFASMIQNYMFDKFIILIPFIEYRKFNKIETITFINLAGAFKNSIMVNLIDYDLLQECLHENGDKRLPTTSYEYERFLYLCRSMKKQETINTNITIKKERPNKKYKQ